MGPRRACTERLSSHQHWLVGPRRVGTTHNTRVAVAKNANTKNPRLDFFKCSLQETTSNRQSKLKKGRWAQEGFAQLRVSDHQQWLVGPRRVCTVANNGWGPRRAVTSEKGMVGPRRVCPEGFRNAGVRFRNAGPKQAPRQYLLFTFAFMVSLFKP